MKKITELTELKWKPIHYWDDNHNLIHDKEEYIGNRNVRTISEGPRFGHFIIDCLSFRLFTYLIFYVLGVIDNLTKFSANLNLTIILVVDILLLLLYPFLYGFCEYIWQRTPGKYLTKTIVIDEYGNKPDLRTIILRSLIRIVPFEPFSCFGKHSRGWHDRWSNTWVVTENELAEIQKLLSEENIIN